jgi:capsular polysaccharide biosynthesis protein
MPSEHPPSSGPVSISRAVRHHLAVVSTVLLLGALAGWLYATSVPTTYTSTARVLVNPSVGNPFTPTPASVRQDELTSLETEAQVGRSAEVLAAVTEQNPALTIQALERGLRITVPANTQILEISYSATDPVLAQQAADGVANAYLANRDRRFTEVNSARIEAVESQTVGVVTELRAATAAAQVGNKAERLFQAELADALRNELVSLRAQRTALENSQGPAGSVIAPASEPRSAGHLTAILMPVGGGLAGLALGCLLAGLLERFAGVVRSAPEVEAAGLPVVAAVPAPGWHARLWRRDGGDAFDTTIRRLRATILDLDPRPDVIAVAPAGTGWSDADISEAVAESFAKAGHRVVLVLTDGHPTTGGLGIEEQGLAQALLYERLNVLNLLKPSVEPLLCLLLDGGFTAQTRELLVADRLRAVLGPLIEEGHLVVLQAPGIDSADGEAIVGAADLGLVVVTVGLTRPHEVLQVAKQLRTRGTALAALVIGPRGSARRARRPARPSILPGVADTGAGGRADLDVDPVQEATVPRNPLRRPPR